MTSLRRFIRRSIALVRAGKAESELAREISAHLRLLEDQFVSTGMNAEEARLAARRAFGGVEQAKEAQRDARAFGWLAALPMDLKLGVRMLVKSPGLTIIAVIALAVAFCAGTTYLEFVNGLARPRSFPGGDRIVGIVSRDLEQNTVERRVLHDFRAWREGLTLIQGLGVAQEIAGDLTTDDGRAGPVDGVRISSLAFRLVPAAPLLGRPLVDGDEDRSAPPVAVIGEALWQSRFNRDPQVIGRTVTLAAVRYTIVGVMPASFGFPVNQNLWIPFRDDRAPVKRGQGPPISVFGRLAPGATIEGAQAELVAVTARAAAAVPQSTQSARAEVKPYVASLISALDLNGQVVALYAVNLAFVALLGLCAANVATLVFGRTVTREAELTVRSALGASRIRVIAQLVAEALVLVSIAAGVGLAGATLALRWVRRAWQAGQGSAMPFWWNESVDGETFLYTAVLVVIAAIIVGGIPALKATGPEIQGRLKHAGAGSTMKFGRLWTGVIVMQVAVTVVFLLSIVSLAWSIVIIQRQYENVSFERGNYVTARLAPNNDSGPVDAAVIYRQRQEFMRRLLDAPAVASATYTTRLPGVDQESTYFEVDKAIATVRAAHIGPNFFETFERPIIAGRAFTLREIESGASVAIVDESFVRFVLGGRSALGQQLREMPHRQDGEPGPWIEIVGVTKDMSTAARKTIMDARIYRPIGAIPAEPVNLVVHARPEYRPEGPGRVASAVRVVATEMPETTRVFDLRTMDSGGEGDVIGYVFTAMGIVGGVALLLSTAGIYALVSFTLARRTREIGIRTALGASPRRIVTGILAKAFVQVGLGVLAGVVPGVAIVASVAGASGRNGLADGLAVAAGVAGFVLLIAAAACCVPLRRALHVEPTEALRVT